MGKRRRKKIDLNKKMVQFTTSQFGASMRKMAIDGYIIYTDIKNIKQYIRELQAIGQNINQIARRVNSTPHIYSALIKLILYFYRNR